MVNDKQIPQQALVQLRADYIQLLGYLERMKESPTLTTRQKQELELHTDCQVVNDQLDEWLGDTALPRDNIVEHIAFATWFMAMRDEVLPNSAVKRTFLELRTRYCQVISEHTNHRFNVGERDR